jgi:hypothetical protein
MLQKGPLGENGAAKDEKAKARLGPLEEVLAEVAKRNVTRGELQEQNAKARTTRYEA